MRISTAGFNNSSVAIMQRLQTQLSKTNDQLASGRRVQTPADDPIAAVHIMELERSLQANEQFGKNADIATNRLTLEEQALADTGNLLRNMQALTIQGNNAPIDANSRKLLAIEVRTRLSELVGIANRKDANGEFLFAGFATQTQPFGQSGGAVNYFGDQGSRSLQVGPDQRVPDSHSGYQVFMSAPQGNGTFVTDANPANTGTGIVAGGAVTNPSQWIPDDYTLRFTSAAGDYEILDSSAAVIGAGTHTADGVISFRGVNVNLTGVPGLNDSFSIARSRTEDVFTTLESLATTLESSTITPAARAQFNTNMGKVLQQLDTSSDHLLGVRAEVGTRLSGLENAGIARADQTLELQRVTAELRDLDYLEAISRMNSQMVGLQAAQASYAKISQLSLFDYLR